MTTYQQTKKLYKEGLKTEAYKLYLQDENSLKVSYDEFCNGFDKVINK